MNIWLPQLENGLYALQVYNPFVNKTKTIMLFKDYNQGKKVAIKLDKRLNKDIKK